MGDTNLVTTFFERAYSAFHEQSPPPEWFRHTPVTYSGPVLIVFPGTLTPLEQSEVGRWLVSPDFEKPARLAQCTQRAAIAKITEYIAYYATASYLNWRDTDNAARIAQWRYFVADTIRASKATVPSSNDVGGGSAPIAVSIPAGDNI